MSSSSSSSNLNQASADQPGDGQEVLSIAQRIDRIADVSDAPDEFLRRFAAELQQAFQAALVAIEADATEAPMMLVADERTAEVIDRQGIRQLLRTSQSTPIACAVAAGEQTTDAMRVELNPKPHRTAMLIVQPIAFAAHTSDSASAVSSAGNRIRSLQTLQEYVVQARSILDRWYRSTRFEQAEPSGDAPNTIIHSPAPVSRDSLRTFHRDLNPDATAYRIANETRRMLQCDRVTVLLPKGKAFKVHAVSGVAVIDRRSNAIRSVESLATQASVMSGPLILPAEDAIPPQVQDPLDRYLDETDVTSCVLLPLNGPNDRPVTSRQRKLEASESPEWNDEFDPFDSNGQRLGMVVLEYFGGHDKLTIHSTARAIASEATLALRNANEHQQVFGLSLLKAVGRAKRSRHRWGWITGFTLLFAMLLAAWNIEIDHEVIATGQAQPQIRRNVFANVDGVVKELFVKNGDVVREGQPLMQLENAELENQSQALEGQLQTAQERLISLRSMRLSREVDQTRAAQLAMEQRQLDTEILGLQRQLELIQTQLEALEVRSPISGRVIGWRLEDRLLERPVNRGNQLLTIVDESGPWELAISIPDQQVGPILASAEKTPSLPVTFAIATEPTRTYDAVIDSIATATRLDESGQFVLDATALIQSDTARTDTAGPDTGQQATDQVASVDSTKPRSSWNGSEAMIGADVTARIACDKRSVLASWMSDVVDFFHRHVFFHFR